MQSNDFDLILKPDRKLKGAMSELWSFRELFYVLAWRDFKVRYKQTIIGVLWAFIRPLVTMIVFTIIFSKVAGLPSQGEIPYALLVFAAMLPWFFFSTSFQEGTNALTTDANIISKVYFPRIIIPISSLFVNLVDMSISLGIFFLLMIFFGFSPSSNLMFLPLFVVLAAALTIACTLWMSALNVMYRDVRYVIPFIVQFGLYLCPVGFASETISNEWRWVYSLNPMVGIIDGFRWSLLGADIQFYLPSLMISIFITLFLLVGGYRFFMKMERNFADII